ncbi:YcnI family protein [Luteimicrobium subarcticum]|uniref:Uncharacterized protein YcnI n=1 Tax=Luteimicrobium subarcticum TaxID=620910 RepID=A0A2M8WRM8_9MICO|nr:YcnI family protein [Luteimicrobium subarcticum]PJI93600.1 uncharacterized protein YcnI [Luteimicrobium subarcticum]
MSRTTLLPRRPARTIGASLLAGGTAVVLVAALPLAAQAHVHVTPDQATPGDYAALTFRVPTESDTASTVKVEVDLPTDTPFSYVAYKPLPGWTAKITTSKLDKPVKTDAGATITEAPTKIVWTADKGQGVAPGQFQEFEISAGAVPDAPSILLPAIQTYSDGSVVTWDDPTPASGEEPENPAPTLYITATPPAEDDGGTAAPSVTPTTVPDDAQTATGAVPAQGTVAAGSTTSDDDSGNGVAIGLGVAGLVLGAAGLVAGLVALRRSRA